jgi:hypothetical protein
LDDVIDAGDDGRVFTVSIEGDDFDGDDVDFLGDTVILGTDETTAK